MIFIIFQTEKFEKGFGIRESIIWEEYQVCIVMVQLKLNKLQVEQAIKESDIELHIQEEDTRLLAKQERLQLRGQLMQARIEAGRVKCEVTLGEQIDYDSVISHERSVRVHDNLERYLSELTPSAIPGQTFEHVSVRETGKYTLT